MKRWIKKLAGVPSAVIGAALVVAQPDVQEQLVVLAPMLGRDGAKVVTLVVSAGAILGALFGQPPRRKAAPPSE